MSDESATGGAAMTPSPSPGPSSAGFEPGRIIAGRYRILSKLGEGAMGAVYLGEHIRMGRKDAIKVLRGGLSGDAESLARFNRGARNLSAIRHPNVCTLYDYGETEDGSPFLALEFITGESLKDLIDREGALDPERATHIARQVADALDAAHDAGIVHRDLKPGNIMIEKGRDGRDVVKVVDFDIAKGPEPATGDEVTRLGYVVGTPEYMSPEQLMGDKLDGRSDLYSLGLVYFRMLSGELPFRGNTTQEIMVQRLTAPPLRLEQLPVTSQYPQEMQRILDRSLARERAERYDTAAQMSLDLAALMPRLAGWQAAAGPPSAVPPTVVEPAPTRQTQGRTAPSSAARSGAGVATPGPMTPPSSRRVPVIAGIAAVAVIAAASFVASRLRARSTPGASPPIKVEDDTANMSPPAGGQTGGTGGRQQRAEPPPGGAGTQGGTGGRQAGPGTASGGGRQTDSTGQTTPPQTGPGPTTPPALTPAAAEDALFRMVDLIAGNEPAKARIARDSAQMIWNMTGQTDANRALAAYVIANTAYILQDRASCNEWIDRALQLDSTNSGYKTFLNTCQRMGS